MLKSVYENGGFYIGRYEAGTRTPRYLATDEIIPAKSQSDLYPYNFITCKQAQELATGMAIGGKTSSLMFGIQWDLVMKFIEEKGTKLGETKEERQTKLKTDSSDWGNYKDIGFTITKGKYTATPNTVGSWTDAAPSYSKPSSDVLLTTGATDRNSVLGIFDLAGNVWEWTLEKYYSGKSPAAYRGGGGNVGGTVCPVSRRVNGVTEGSYGSYGFRPALW